MRSDGRSSKELEDKYAYFFCSNTFEVSKFSLCIVSPSDPILINRRSTLHLCVSSSKSNKVLLFKRGDMQTVLGRKWKNNNVFWSLYHKANAQNCLSPCRKCIVHSLLSKSQGMWVAVSMKTWDQRVQLFNNVLFSTLNICASFVVSKSTQHGPD